MRDCKTYKDRFSPADRKSPEKAGAEKIAIESEVREALR